MELVWQNAFHVEKILPEEHQILITESPLSPKENRQKIVESMFETFNVLGTYIAIPAQLAVYVLFFSLPVTNK